MSRPFCELLHPDDALPVIQEWAAAAPRHVEVLPCAPEAGQRTLEALQVTTRSPLGALAYHTGGALVDHGWLRILGAGCDRLPRALDGWNGLETGTRRFDRGLLVGDDVLGGFFAWFDEPRSIHYFGPDSLQWEDLQLGYTDWLASTRGDRPPARPGHLRLPAAGDEDGGAPQPAGGAGRRALARPHAAGRELNGLPDGARVILEPTK